MKKSITYAEITKEDFEFWLKMGLKLWQDHDVDELRDELTRIFNTPGRKTFIAKNKEQEPIGFAYFSIRNDYVEGAEKSPTGYLEGIFIEEKYRRQGIAKQFIKMGEDWLKQNNCTQIGSDTWITSIEAQDFHKGLGFWEEERLVHYLKDI